MNSEIDFIRRSPAPIGDFTVQGTSRAGIGTSLSIPSLGVCFDVANGIETAIPAQIHLVTHGHMDHAGGIPYILSQRGLHSLPPARMVMPEVIVKPMKRIMNEWSNIEGFQYQFDFQPARLGIATPFRPQWDFVPFATVHRVPSVGYTLFETRKILKAEYQGRSEKELSELARTGVELADLIRKPRISFTGDTQIEVIQKTPQLMESEIVFIEVTYFGGPGTGGAKSVADARAWGHIHLDEMLEQLPHLEKVKHLVFIHPSRRHPLTEINQTLNRRLPEAWKSRVHVFT